MTGKTLRFHPLSLAVAAVAVAGLLAAAPLVAQPQAAAGPGHGPGHRMGGGHGMDHGMHHGMHHGMGGGLFGGRGFERLATHLELTEAQRTEAQAIHQAAREQALPLGESSRTLHGELRELLAQEAPDAAAVGERMIAIHANRAQVRQVHADARASFEALLTPAQRTKLQELEASRDENRGRRGDRGKGRGEGKPRGERGGVS